jgi:hypothetical protein
MIQEIGIDPEPYINDIISNEILSYIQKTCFKKDQYSNPYFLDERDKDEQRIVDDLSYLTYCECKKYFISSPRIVTLLSNHPMFSVYFSHAAGIGSLYSLIGKYDKTEILINNLLKHDDNFILLFDSVEISLKIIDSKIVDEATFSPRTIIEFLFDYRVINPKPVYFIENKDSEFYSEFLLKIRDEKINKIIN